MSEFKRENRYLVFKRTDMAKYLTEDDQRQLERIRYNIATNRMHDGKMCFKCVIIEEDWPEYEPTWKAIENRMKDKP